MNSEIKQKWIDALRSGKYVQGEGSLHDAKMTGMRPDQKCCCVLGVLNDISGLGDWEDNTYFIRDMDFDQYIDVWAWENTVRDSEHLSSKYKVSSHPDAGRNTMARTPTPKDVEDDPVVKEAFLSCFMGEEECLHKKVARWAGLDDQAVTIKYRGKYKTLYELNDEEHLSFEELATIIEESL